MTKGSIAGACGAFVARLRGTATGARGDADPAYAGSACAPAGSPLGLCLGLAGQSLLP